MLGFTNERISKMPAPSIVRKLDKAYTFIMLKAEGLGLVVK